MKILAKVAFALLVPVVTMAQSILPNWDSELRKEHPRLLVNEEILTEIRVHAKTKNIKEYNTLREYVYAPYNLDELELYTDRFTMKENGKIKLNVGIEQGPEVVRNTGCRHAGGAAMLYLISGSEQDKELALKFLRHANRYVRYCLDVDLPVDYQTEHIISFMCAYDWMYNDLTREEQIDIGKNIAEYTKEMQSDGRLKVFKTDGDPTTGFYGTMSLLFPAGIVLYGNGIDDNQALGFLNRGYDLYTQAMKFRDEVAGDQGLLVASTPTYSLAAYPLATFLFFHMNKAALDKDVTMDYKHMQSFINWFLWSAIPDNEGGFYHYGVGDVMHNTNRFEQSLIYSHFVQIANFYCNTLPLVASQALALIDTLPEERKKFNDWHPFMPMLMTNVDLTAKSETSIKELTEDETGCFFPIFGLAFMRSGYSPEDTFAVFRTGSESIMHQHYDENSFVIYRQGYQAVDTGNRGRSSHHIYYYPQTVAHNSILIDYPDEDMPPFWNCWPADLNEQMMDDSLKNDGGQFSRVDGVKRIFETNKEFTWTSGDATKSYIPEKCVMAQREFVFLPPNLFVVYDKVESTKPEYRKRYILHTLSEPYEYKFDWWAAYTGEGGQLRWTTLLPKDATSEFIGGAGQQFVTNGKNFPLLNGEEAFAVKNYYGEWRQEISTPKESSKVEFLNVLQAAVPGEAGVAAQLIKEGDCSGVLIYASKGISYKVLFNPAQPGGRVEKFQDGVLMFSQLVEE